ncbi:hypothetical protein DTO027B5_2353 [Paecilomyces variotii]|nr:hypothetical protein DTO027B5_2353 [Paecilomyces variotii]
MPSTQHNNTFENIQDGIQALLSALEDQAAAAIKNATDVNGEKIEHPRPEAYVWAVDLYDEDAMDNDLLSALRANRVDSFKANTGGRTMAILIRWWSDELSEQERQRYSKPIMGVVAGALFLINILVRGDFFSQAGTNIKDQDLIWNKEEWNDCLRALREAADIISKWDWETKVDDINEFFGQKKRKISAEFARGRARIELGPDTNSASERDVTILEPGEEQGKQSSPMSIDYSSNG